MIRYLLLSFIIGILIVSDTYAQEDYSNMSSEDIFYIAEDYVDMDDFQSAIDLFKVMLERDKDNANLNYKVGFCYLQILLQKEKSIEYLEKALKGVSTPYDPDSFKEKNSPIETYYYLGTAYHMNYRFEDAINIFNEFKNKNISDDKLLQKVNREIEYCKNAIQLMKYPVKIYVTNLGNAINSEYSEHSPVISADEQTLIFTSRREGSSSGNKTDDGQYFEDIYISHKDENGIWGEPKLISENINTEGHDATVGLSVDGQELFIYKDDKGDGNLYSSIFDGEDWSVPVLLGGNINTKNKENHATLSADGQSIYFTSDRPGGIGGLDVYVVKRLPNGDWSKAQNLGPSINTPYDEQGPYLHPDGTTLFFSSKGHNSMGGFDVFFSSIQDDNSWSVPSNCGYPINSTEDDVFYIISVDGKRAYYSSHQYGGIGEKDLYIVNIPGSQIEPLTVMKGIVALSDGKDPDGVKITVKDIDTDKVVGTYTPNSKTGKFLFILAPEKTYNIYCEAENYMYYAENLTVPNETAYQEIERAIILKPIILQGRGCDYVVSFEQSNSEINEFEKYKLDNLYSFLSKNSNMNTVIINPDEIPMFKERSENVLTYLEEKGVNRSNVYSYDNMPSSQGNIISLKLTEIASDILASSDNKKDDTLAADDKDVILEDVTVSNLTFDFDEDKTILYFQDLDRLASYMTKNENAVVEIIGHTDEQGDDIYNVGLSLRRARFVSRYLISKGVNENMLIISGMGESNLIAKDLNPISRKYNRRVEFKVKKQGNNKLKINQIDVPDKYKL